MAGPDDIVSEVDISGVDKATQDLERLGQTGEAAFNKIADAASRTENVGPTIANIGQAAGDIDKVEKAAERFGKSLGDVGDTAKELASQLPRLAGAVAQIGAAITAAMFGVAKAGADAVDAIRDAAIQAGTTTQQFQKLAFAAGQLGANTSKLQRVFALINAAGEKFDDTANKDAEALERVRDQSTRALESNEKLRVEQDKVNLSFAQGKISLEQLSDSQTHFNDQQRDINRQIDASDRTFRSLLTTQKGHNEETKKGLGVLKNFGIQLKGTGGEARDATEVLKDFADVMAKIKDPAQRAALAAQVLGRRVGPGLVELLSQGRKGIEGMGKEAERLGLVFTDAEVKVGDNFNDSLRKLLDTIGALTTRIGLAFGPNFIKIFDNLTEAVVKVSPAIIKLADVIGNQLLGAIVKFQDAVGPVGTAISAFGFAITGVIFSIGILVKILGPVARVFKAGFAPFLTLGRGVLLLFRLLIGSAGVLVGLFRLIGVVAGVAFGPLVGLVAAIGFAVGFLIVQLAKLDWNKVAENAKKAWESIKQFVSDAGTFIVDKWNQVIEFFSGLWDQIVSRASQAWDQVKQVIAGAAQSVADRWTQIVQFFADIWEQIKQMASDAWTFIADTVNGAFARIAEVWGTIVSFFDGIWTSIKSGVQSAWDFVVSTVQGALQRVLDFIQPVVDALKTLWDWAKKAASALFGTGQAAAATGGAGFAGGGPVRGPGTSRSDSILARLSTGEFVVNAMAVAQLTRRFGSGIMHAINRGMLPLQGLADGGFVSSFAAPLGPLPAFALGGAVPRSLSNRGASGTPVVLNIDGEQFNLFTRERDTAQRMGRFATQRRLSSTGRKPTYYGSR